MSSAIILSIGLIVYFFNEPSAQRLYSPPRFASSIISIAARVHDEPAGTTRAKLVALPLVRVVGRG
jgi:hypothetical protein